jgi:outer membrane protein TolC
MSQASFNTYEAIRLQLVYDVKAAYYEYYFLGQELQISRENFELLTFWESVVQSKYRVGLKEHPDVIKVQVELGELEDHIRTLQEERPSVAARLRSLLNLPVTVDLPIPGSISVKEFSLQRDSVIALIKRSNPDLQAIQQVVESRRAGERLAKKMTLPMFSLGVEYMRNSQDRNASMSVGSWDAWMIGGTVSLPIWIGKNRARTREAQARRRVAEYRLQDSENQIVAMTENLLFEYSDALRKTRLYRDGLVPKGQQSLNASYAAYQAGEADFLNVLDAQRQLLDFQLTVAREQTRLATRRAHLERLSGMDLTKYEQR